MGTPAPEFVLTRVLELFKSGAKLPERAMEELIAAGEGVEEELISILQSRAVADESYAPLWALIVLGERRSERALPEILQCISRGNNLVGEGVEFALLRLGERALKPTLEFLRASPDLPGRAHLFALLVHLRTPEAVEYLLSQLCPEARDFVDIAWALAATRDPRAIEALERAVEEFGNSVSGLKEALEAHRRNDDLANPLLGNWRGQWTWEGDEKDGENDEIEEHFQNASDEPDLGLTPRCYDVSCPVCSSVLEYDTQEDSVRILREAVGKTIGRNDLCPCGSGEKYKRCCGRK